MEKHINTLPRFVVLDGWRGICACMVALLHLKVNSHLYPIPIIRSAGFFVDFFFVLSGFVIFANYEQRMREGFSFFKFMFLRFGRLYPLHLAMLLAFVASDAIQLLFPSLLQYAQYQPFQTSGEAPSAIISQLFLFHALDFQAVHAFNAPSWSISAEFYTYAVFAIAIILLRAKAYIFCLAMLLFLTPLLGIIFAKFNHYMFLEGFLRCLCGFGAGALCWKLWQRWQDKILAFNFQHVIWSVLEIMTVLSIFIMIEMTRGTLYQYIAPWLFSLTILVFAFEKGIVSSLLKKPFFVLLGLLSYSIYMVHSFIASKVLPLLAKVIGQIFNMDPFAVVDDRRIINVGLWQGDLITLFYLIVVIGVSYVTYKLIEDPGRQLSRKLVQASQRKSPLPVT